jgi:hypothetical protein
LCASLVDEFVLRRQCSFKHHSAIVEKYTSASIRLSPRFHWVQRSFANWRSCIFLLVANACSAAVIPLPSLAISFLSFPCLPIHCLPSHSLAFPFLDLHSPPPYIPFICLRLPSVAFPCLPLPCIPLPSLVLPCLAFPCLHLHSLAFHSLAFAATATATRRSRCYRNSNTL